MTTNGQLTDREARRLSGDGASTPPGPLSSTSEGDLRKGSYRRSGWARLATLAVVNDDGTKVTSETDRLLEELISLTRQVLAELKEQTRLMKE